MNVTPLYYSISFLSHAKTSQTLIYKHFASFHAFPPFVFFILTPIYRENLDYLVLEGGANDFANLNYRTRMGVMTEGFDNNFDSSTILGALEGICYELANNVIPRGTKVGYIISHKITANYGAYFDKIKEVLRKWNIPFLDLWNDCPINLNIPSHEVTFGYVNKDGNTDGWHLNQFAYQYLRAMVNAWLKSL